MPRRKTDERDSTRDCCVIYLRVSTDEQLSSGAGLEAQEDECRRYAERQGWPVVAVVTETATSGTTQPRARPGFREAVEHLDGCRAGVLLVRREDRISRRIRDLLATIDHGDAAGWGIATTDGRLDTTTASGRLQINTKASFAQYERDLISERTREALAARKERGVRLGRRPAVSLDTAAHVAELRATGLSMQAVADALNDQGVPYATGAKSWTWKRVQSSLASHALNLYAASRTAQPLIAPRPEAVRTPLAVSGPTTATQGACS